MTDELTRHYKHMTLLEICEFEGIDYKTLVNNCTHDCRKVWRVGDIMPFDEFLSSHLLRVLNDIRRNPGNINNYR